MTRPPSRAAAARGLSGRAGFTLLEVILAVALTLLVAGTTLGFYRYVMDLRDRIGQEADMIATQRIVMDRLTTELRGAMTHPLLEGMSGTAYELSFATCVLPGRSAWAVTGPTEEPPLPEFDLHRVTYRLRYEENAAGEWTEAGLERLCEKVALGRRSAEEETGIEGEQVEPPSALLSSRIRMIYFLYHDGVEWIDVWPPPAAEEGQGGEEEDAEAQQRRTAIDLPLAVEINLGTEPMPEGMTIEEYRVLYPTFRRRVFVPGGARALSGAIMRGMGGSLR